MYKKGKEFLSLSISEDAFKVAVLKFIGGGAKVIDVLKKDLREVPESERIRVVQAAVSELNLKNPSGVCAIPPELVTTKNIEIPSLEEEEIRSIIDLQAGRHTPFSREEILVGYITIGIFQRNYTKILLIIVNRDDVKKQLGVLESAGIRIDRVVFAPEAMAKCYAQALHVQEEDVPVGIIDIANQQTTYLIEFNRTVAMCRSIPLGMSHLIKEGQPAFDKLVSEIVSSQETYQSEDINKLPEQYLLTSDDAKVKDLQPVLKEKLKSNVKVMSYLDQVSADQPVMLKFVSEYNDESFFNLTATGQALSQLRVDLTPEEVRTQRMLEEKGKQIVKSGICGVVILALIVSVFFSKIYFKGLVMDRIEKEYVVNRRMVMALDKTAQKTRIIKDYVNGRIVALDVLQEIYRLIPKEIYLQSILLDEEGSITIQGISESMSRVFNFVSALDESEAFKNVKTRSTTATKDRGKDVASFEITFKLESAKDEVEGEAPEGLVEEETAEEEG